MRGCGAGLGAGGYQRLTYPLPLAPGVVSRSSAGPLRQVVDHESLALGWAG